MPLVCSLTYSKQIISNSVKAWGGLGHPMAQDTVPGPHFKPETAADQRPGRVHLKVLIDWAAASRARSPKPPCDSETRCNKLKEPSVMSDVRVDTTHSWIMVMVPMCGCEQVRVLWHCHRRKCRKGLMCLNARHQGPSEAAKG